LKIRPTVEPHALPQPEGRRGVGPRIGLPARAGFGYDHLIARRPTQPERGVVMLTLWGARERFCDGISRRGFLTIGAFGAGLTLGEMLRLRAAGASTGAKGSSNKAAIMIYLPGGPSHMYMYDLKPQAPTEFKGEFKPIKTNVPGVEICEH